MCCHGDSAEEGRVEEDKGVEEIKFYKSLIKKNKVAMIEFQAFVLFFHL